MSKATEKSVTPNKKVFSSSLYSITFVLKQWLQISNSISNILGEC